jgi:integrase
MQGHRNTGRVKTRVPGIYYRETESGDRRYSFTYRDSGGRQHWRTVNGGLEEAKSAQAEMVVRKGTGERIEPTRLTFEQAASRWLDSKLRLREKTRTGYEGALRNHLLPALGRKPIHAITEDDIARLIRQLEAKGMKPWSIRGQALTPLSGIFKHAVRRGWRSDNPVRNLEADEKPAIESRPKRILEEGEIRRLIEKTPTKYEAVIRTAVFTGLRLGELLGLKWSDVDFTAGVIRVRRQLTQQGELGDPKTSSGKRDVVMFPDLGRSLRKHRLASPFSAEDDFVFATREGTPHLQGNVTKRGLDKAAMAAELTRPGEPKLRMHDLRHCFASMLIREGADVVFVARQLGHANPAITLRVYAHLFDSEAQAKRMRDSLEARFGGNAVVTSEGESPEKTGTEDGGEVLSMRPEHPRQPPG